MKVTEKKKTHPSVSTVQIGKQGEDQAEKLLVQNGWRIIERGDTRTAWDIRAEKEGNTFCINVKNGKKGNQIGVINLKRLLTSCLEGAIPAYMFLLEEGYLLFSLEEGKKIHLNGTPARIFYEYIIEEDTP